MNELDFFTDDKPAVEMPQDMTDFFDAAPEPQPTKSDKKPRLLGQVRTLSDAFKPREKKPCIVHGHVYQSSLNLYTGLWGSLKSNLLFDQFMCVAAGIPWLQDVEGNGGIAVTQCPVLWVDIDNGSDIVEERLRAFARAYHVDPDEIPFKYLVFPKPALSALKGLSELKEAMMDLKVGLLGIDNLLRVAGTEKENDAVMDKAMNNLRSLCEDTRAGISVVHHTTKDGERSRGHGSIEAAVDFHFRVTRSDNGTGDLVTVTNPKFRRAPVKTYTAMWTHEQDEDDDLALHSCRFFVGEKVLSAEMENAIKMALSNGEQTITDNYTRVGGNKQKHCNAVNAMIGKGEILCRGGGGKGKAKWIRLPQVVPVLSSSK